jgi:hypothetical protein
LIVPLSKVTKTNLSAAATTAAAAEYIHGPVFFEAQSMSTLITSYKLALVHLYLKKTFWNQCHLLSIANHTCPFALG